MEQLRMNIHQWLIEHQCSIIDHLQRLIKAAGHPDQPENHVQDVFINHWNQNNYDVRVHPLNEVDWTKIPILYLAKPVEQLNQLSNVSALIRGSGGGRSLLLNGHVDVVPVGKREQWYVDPFGGELIDGKVYGRGATDMLGGIVSMEYALESIRKCGIKLKGDVTICAVVEEESGGAGSAASVLQGITADAAIIAEPTACQLYPIQQGSQWFRIHIRGKGAHGGTRDLGVSAIEIGMNVIKAIHRLEANRHERGFQAHLHRANGIAYPINIGTFHAGNWPSSVADEAILEGRYGLMPGQSMQAAFAEMEDVILKLNAQDKWLEEHPITLEWYGARWLPNALEAEHPWYDVWKQLPIRLGRDIKAAPWGTDAGWLAHIGNIPVMVYGPGTPEQAHQPNESILISDVILAAEEIAIAMMLWCGYDIDQQE